jgi:hypothetical protein
MVPPICGLYKLPVSTTIINLLDKAIYYITEHCKEKILEGKM